MKDSKKNIVLLLLKSVLFWCFVGGALYCLIALLSGNDFSWKWLFCSVGYSGIFLGYFWGVYKYVKE